MSETSPFVVWAGQQAAIGEVMTQIGNGSRQCIGYAEFVEKWGDFKFRRWFRNLESDLLEPAGQESKQRLRRLYFSLNTLKKYLDPQGGYEPVFSL
jgi:hypothetical protein